MPQLIKFKKVRLRLDVYDPTIQNYRPYPGKGVVIPMKSTVHHRALWRSLIEWLKTEDWKNDIRADESPEDK